MAAHPMGVGVSLSSLLELGLDSQVSGLTTRALLPIGMRKCSSEAIRMTCSHAFFKINFPIIAIIVQLAGGPYLILCTANHCKMILMDQVNIRPMSTA
jgi:hypothetical protein